MIRRAPRGARGLKSQGNRFQPHYTKSRPARGAWIEIPKTWSKIAKKSVAPREGRVD